MAGIFNHKIKNGAEPFRWEITSAGVFFLVGTIVLMLSAGVFLFVRAYENFKMAQMRGEKLELVFDSIESHTLQLASNYGRQLGDLFLRSQFDSFSKKGQYFLRTTIESNEQIYSQWTAPYYDTISANCRDSETNQFNVENLVYPFYVTIEFNRCIENNRFISNVILGVWFFFATILAGAVGYIVYLLNKSKSIVNAPFNNETLNLVQGIRWKELREIVFKSLSARKVDIEALKERHSHLIHDINNIISTKDAADSHKLKEISALTHQRAKTSSRGTPTPSYETSSIVEIAREFSRSFGFAYPCIGGEIKIDQTIEIDDRYKRIVLNIESNLRHSKNQFIEFDFQPSTMNVTVTSKISGLKALFYKGLKCCGLVQYFHQNHSRDVIKKPFGKPSHGLNIMRDVLINMNGRMNVSFQSRTFILDLSIPISYKYKYLGEHIQRRFIYLVSNENIKSSLSSDKEHVMVFTAQDMEAVANFVNTNTTIITDMNSLDFDEWVADFSEGVILKRLSTGILKSHFNTISRATEGDA